MVNTPWYERPLSSCGGCCLPVHVGYPLSGCEGREELKTAWVRFKITLKLLSMGANGAVGAVAPGSFSTRRHEPLW